MHRLRVLVLEGVRLFDLAIPLQVFHLAEGYELATCAYGRRPLASVEGPAVTPELGLEALDEADTVIVPGFEPNIELPAPTRKALQRAARNGSRLASVCTGTFALAEAGVLDSRSVTTHWQRCDELAKRYPALTVDPDALYIDHGDIATSAGMAAGIDLCLHLLRNDRGASDATIAARRMVVPPHRNGGQAQLLERAKPATASELASTCAWALENLDQPLRLGDLARHAGLSTRTFSRQFKEQTGTTPRQWIVIQRTIEARRLLEETNLPMDRIASLAGVGTAANLRLLILRDAHVTPTTYRRTYRGSSP